MTYDTAGPKTQVSDPDTGTTTYSYDSDGNLYEAIDARGVPGITWTGYDNLDRPIWRNTQNSATNPTANFVYDTGTNGKGRLPHDDFTGAPVTGCPGSDDDAYEARGFSGFGRG